MLFVMFSGYYLYIETSPPRVEGDNAKLELYASGNGELSCLEFYYHMYGDTMGTLTVFSESAVIFNASGNHGNTWKKAEITIHLESIVSFNQKIHDLPGKALKTSTSIFERILIVIVESNMRL